MVSRFLSSSLCVAALSISSFLNAEAPKTSPLTLTADHSDAIYQQGENVTFTVQLNKNAHPIGQTEVRYTIGKEGMPSPKKGFLKLVKGSGTITGKLDEPGFLSCSVNWDQAGTPFNATFGVAVDPLLIKPSLPVPDDFDTFWAEQKLKLAAVPMNPRLTPVPTPTVPEVETFDVQVDSVGAGVSGYLSKPVGAKPKSLPIILTVQGAGVRTSNLVGTANWAKNGILAMDINAHGLPNGKPEAFYKALAEGELKEYRTAGSESRDTIYFLNMFLRDLRALDFLCTQPEWDGKTVVVYGTSQGGFQAFATAALDDRVTFFMAGVPAGCDHTGFVANRVSGWPKLVPMNAEGKPNPKSVEASRYFDNVNFAAKTKAKAAFVTAGFIDPVCPPTTVYAAYNNLPIAKQIFNDIGFPHSPSPAANAAMSKAALDYIKSVK